MAGATFCVSPIWQDADFTPCFREKYINLFLPTFVTLASASSLLISIRVIARRASCDKAPHQQQLEVASISPDEAGAVFERSTCCRCLELPPSSVRNLAVVLDGATLGELLVLGGLLSVNISSFLRAFSGGDSLLQPAAAVSSWFYAALILILPLLVQKARWQQHRPWVHSGVVYLTQWLITVVNLRSALLDCGPSLNTYTLSLEIVLQTILVGIMLFRRGQDGAGPTSLEQRASIFSRLTFFWMDAMLLKGYTKGISIDMMRHFDRADMAQTILASYRLLRKDAALSWKLASLFKGLLILQGTWAFVSGILTVAPALLLNLILTSIEQPGRYPQHLIWLFVILFPLIDLIKSVAEGQALWQGHKLCLRTRALLIGEVFRLTIDRKPSHEKAYPISATKSTHTMLERLKTWVQQMLPAEEGTITLPINASIAGIPDSEDQTTDQETGEKGTGNIINLMSIDSYKIGDAISNLHLLIIQAPVQILITIAMLYRILGWSAFSGISMMLLTIPFNVTLGKGLVRNQENMMASTDRRIHTSNDLFRNIRTVKFFVWERHFSALVNNARKMELKGLRKRFILWAAFNTAWYAVPALTTLISLFCFTTLEGKTLRPSLAFASVSMFTLLSVPLGNVGHVLAQVTEAVVSMRRIEEFLGDGGDMLLPVNTPAKDNTDDPMLGFHDAHFSWSKHGETASAASTTFQLHEMDFCFHTGKLNVVVGQTGAGKSSLLLALLGEMRLVEGDISFSDTRSRAYVAQTPWIFHGTIRENILFSTPYDAKRYHHVIEICALERDLHGMSDGDATITGENGVTLSGGQKQRISLARAIYSHSRTVLLDDCLSALDPPTAQFIFENCIRELPGQGRTCVLVTHNTALCVPVADFVVVLDKGRAIAQGPPRQIFAAGLFPEADYGALESQMVRMEQALNSPKTPPEVWQSRPTSPSNIYEIAVQPVNQMLTSQDSANASGAGVVGWSASKLYLVAMGAWPYWIILLLLFAAEHMAGVASTLWIGKWSNASMLSGNMSDTGIQPTLRAHAMLHLSSQSRFGHSSPNTHHNLIVASQMLPTDPSSHATNHLPHILVLAIISLSSILFVIMREAWAAFGSLTASRKLHTRLLDVVTKTTFHFFDTTPLGQIMNRFSKDMEIIDQQMTPGIIYIVSLVLDTIISVVVIAWTTPQLLIAGCLIVSIYLGVATFYLRSSRELKEHEARGRSPLFQQFGEVLTGLVTIRAYNNERLFIESNAERIDTQSRPFLYLWAANRWLALRTEFLGNLLFVLTSVFVLLSDNINPGLAAVSLTYAMSFSTNLIWLVRQYAVFEQNMNSVHRISGTMSAEQEPGPDTARCHPNGSWPSHGVLEFRNFSARYRPDLDLCLRDISFRANHGERVGIVGRTGAGKSTLGLALFRALEAEKGAIFIDDVDISQITLNRLRQSVAIVPQDPSLFAGTIRSNIDPLFEHSDAEVDAVLDHVQLSGTAESGLHAGTSIIEGGANFSQGQRQLLCLARALLWRSRILIVDEATASIDHASDTQVQAVLSGLDATIVTVAHRIATVADHDRIVVLDHGAIIEQGAPWALLRDPQSAFRAMCETSGEFDRLVHISDCARRARNIVDIDFLA
ncbi:hypothetical protein G6011_03184 [Alternaria panax]|uniref:ATP-dependent bile acid permease n=1 Tax=Alternaria panax TaxID=48097 RepID=A0AAD4NSW3_9PLEO|nr:hypothetical protein G6011_03184 [Alternaria panax]